MGDHAHKTRHEIWLGLWFVSGDPNRVRWRGRGGAFDELCQAGTLRPGGALSLGSSSSMVLRDGSSLSG